MVAVKEWVRAALRAFLAEPKTVTPATILPPTLNKGFFSTAGELPFDEDKSWERLVDMVQPKVFQLRKMPIVRESYAQDGSMAVAQDDLGSESGASNYKSVFSMGGGGQIPYAQMDYFASQSFIGYQMCAMLLQHWFIEKACTMPARDAIRNGYEVTRSDGEKMTPQIADEFKRLDKKFKAKKNCVEAIRLMRCFGIRIVLFEVTSTDPDYYLKPFNPDGITPGSYKGMSQIDPYWITPELNFNAAANPASRLFYEPTYWRVNGQRYHRSHLVIIRTCELADVLKPTYFYGGVPLPQRLYERVYAAERTSNEAPQLAMTKRLTVIEGVDMSAVVANPAGFFARIKQWAYCRDNYGVKVSGGDESIKQIDTSLTDMDALIATQWQLACAIVNVPSTKMMGTQPKGFNATGEYESANYREDLESIQEHDAQPILERHHLCCMRSFIVPKFKITPFNTGIEWAEADPETSKEKSDREKQDSDRDKNLAETGAIDAIDIRGRLIKDKDSSYHGIAEALPEGPLPVTGADPGAATLPKTPAATPPPPPNQAPVNGSAAA